MKIEVKKSDLIRAVGLVSKCVNHKHAHPVLSNILLHVKDERLEVIGTNLVGSARVFVPVTTKGEGEALVNAQTFQRILSTLSGDELAIDIDKKVSIAQKGGAVKLNTTDAKKYPNLVFADDWQFRFRRQDLLDALKLSGFALEEEDAVQMFKSTAQLTIFTNLIESKFELMATNHHILSFVNGLCEKQEGVEDGSINIPKAAISHILSILPASDEENVTFSCAPNAVHLSIGDVDYSFSRLAVSYPDLSQAKTIDFPHSFTVSSEWLNEVLKKAQVIADPRKNSCSFVVDEDALTIGAQGDVGEFEESTEITLEGEPLRTSYRIAYLISTLSRTSGDIELKFTRSANAYAMRVEAKGQDVSALMFIQALANFEWSKAA